jgi:hypothetical protein
VLHIFLGSSNSTYSTKREISFLAFRHGTGTRLATNASVTFGANSPIFGVSGVAFGEITNGTTRDISVATGIGNNAFLVTGSIPDGILNNDPNAKTNPNDKFIKAPPMRRLIFAKRRSARGVNLA